MKIEKLTATNFKNLQLRDVPFRGVTLVLGENGVGKSNLLLLLHTLFKRKNPPKERPEQKFAIDGFEEDKDLLRRGADQGSAEATITCLSDEFKDLRKAFFGDSGKKKGNSVTIDFSLTRYSNGVDFRVTRIRLGNGVIYPIPDKDDGKDRAAKQKALEDWANEELTDATTYIPNSRLLKREPVEFKAQEPKDAAADLENTLLRLLTHPDADPDAVDNIKQTLKEFFGVVDVRSALRSKVETPLSAPGGPALPEGPPLGVGIRIKEANSQWFDLSQVGTGIQQILVIATMIHQKAARIALIEEFESSLSIRRRNRLLQQLIEFVGPGKPLRQVIMTSHAIFQPRAQVVHSIGTDHPSARDNVNFRVWTKYDWQRHLRS